MQLSFLELLIEFVDFLDDFAFGCKTSECKHGEVARWYFMYGDGAVGGCRKVAFLVAAWHYKAHGTA